jgi:hypothetical protein
MQERRTKIIVLGGISVALIILCLYGGTIIRNNRIFFLALATFIQAIPYIKGGIGGGVTSYAAASVLGFLLIPNKLYAGFYIFFGMYALIKLLAERQKIVAEIIIKYLWFNVTIIGVYIIYKNVIFLNGFLAGTKGLIIIFVGLQLLFLLYDYVFTKFIIFIDDRILSKV